MLENGGASYSPKTTKTQTEVGTPKSSYNMPKSGGSSSPPTASMGSAPTTGGAM